MAVKNDYKQRYHANIPGAWSNDPNGLIWFDGKAHMFCQYYPHRPQWGTMHWGHFVSEDLLHWDFLPTALTPDEPYEVICGCCSGSSIIIDGRLWLFYTAAQPELQRQCLAWSDDGIHFHKHEGNPVLTSAMLDESISPRDFRDPRIFKIEDSYYCLAGIRKIDKEKYEERIRKIACYQSKEEALFYKDIRNLNPSRGLLPDKAPKPPGDPLGDEESIGYGNLVLFMTKDFKNWEYKGILLEKDDSFDEDFFRLDGAYECPDYFELDTKEIILASPQNLPEKDGRFQNLHSVIYMTGKMDFETGHFKLDSIEDLDSGFDIYACQTMLHPDGRRIMIAWKEMWDRSYPTETHGWVGSYTLPRELRYMDGRLYQIPIREIEKYRSEKKEAADIPLHNESKRIEGFGGSCIELSVTFDCKDVKTAGVKVFKGLVHETVIYYDKEGGKVVFDRTSSGISFSGKEENVNVRVCEIGDCDQIDFRIFLDISSVEVFINGGRYVMTGNVYPDPDDTMIEFFAEGTAGIIRAVQYNLS